MLIGLLIVGVVPRQSLTHRSLIQMKATSALRRPARRRTHIHLLVRGLPMCTDLTRCNVEGFLTECVAREDVDEAHNGDKDACGDDEAPVRLAEGVFRGGGLIEVAKDRDAKDDHENAESDEAGGWRQERPVVGDVTTEETNFGDYEGDCWSMSAGNLHF